MRHAFPPPIRLALIVIAGLVTSQAPTLAYAQSIGTIQGYNSPLLRAFNEDRTPFERPLRRDELPRPPVNIRSVRGPTMGILFEGKVIFLRGSDVRYQLNGVVCRPRTPTERGASESVTGTGAGSGSSQDCVDTNP